MRSKVPTYEVASLAGDDITVQPDVGYAAVVGLDAVLVLMAHASDQLKSALEQNPVFANLAAVEGGRLMTVDLVTVAALRTPMVRGIHHALDRLVPEMERALGL